MLVLSRKIGEKIVIGKDIVIMVTAIAGDRVRLGISGPPEVPIHRQEIYQRVQEEERSRPYSHEPQDASRETTGARPSARLCESTQSRGQSTPSVATIFPCVGPLLADAPGSHAQG